MPVLDTQALIDNRVKAIRDYHESINVPKAQIDVSGGVDSAVIVGLLAKALGPENVIAVHSGINTNPDQTARAQEVCEVFGVKLAVIDLTDIYRNLTNLMRISMARAGYDGDAMEERVDADPTILGSIRSTIRAPIGRGFNRLFGGGIRHGTGNECEDRWARFYQKGGDGEVDTNPIAMLAKGEVFQLAKALGVPMSIVTAVPSPDLWGKGDGHNDEDEFADYFQFKASDYGQTFYSYIHPETGEYTSVGLIERVSRFLDIQETQMGSDPHDGFDMAFEELLFAKDADLDTIIATAVHSAPLRDVPSGLVGKLLTAARRIEHTTRHKFNPNCPTLGDRYELVEAGILTDKLPEV